MTPIEERLLQLKADAEELRITSEESEIGFNKVKDFLSVIGKIDTKTKMGKEAFQEGSRKYLDAELDFLRDKSNIIRKVSPKTADFLENKINDYEKSARYVIEKLSENNFDDSSIMNDLSTLFEVAKVIYYMGHLQSIVSVSCDSFLDTIDYLEGNKVIK